MLPPSGKTWMPHSITTNPFFFLFLFSKPPYQSWFYFTYPLTAHWMAAVVLLLIQGKLTDENNGKSNAYSVISPRPVVLRHRMPMCLCSIPSIRCRFFFLSIDILTPDERLCSTLYEI